MLNYQRCLLIKFLSMTWELIFHTLNCLSTHPFIFPFLPSYLPSLIPPFFSAILLPIHPFMMSIQSFIHRSIYPFICPFIHPLTHPFIPSTCNGHRVPSPCPGCWPHSDR